MFERDSDYSRNRNRRVNVNEGGSVRLRHAAMCFLKRKKTNSRLILIHGNKGALGKLPSIALKNSKEDEAGI